MRLPNVFTAIADVAMGYLFVHGSIAGTGQLGCLIAASALLYTAGMVLNDVFDIDIDAKERPFRPLPSGQICLASRGRSASRCWRSADRCGWLAGFCRAGSAAIPWRSGLVASVLGGVRAALRRLCLKHTPLGPLGMGACRFLNVLLGMSAASARCRRSAARLFGRPNCWRRRASASTSSA